MDGERRDWKEGKDIWIVFFKAIKQRKKDLQVFSYNHCFMNNIIISPVFYWIILIRSLAEM